MPLYFFDLIFDSFSLGCNLFRLFLVIFHHLLSLLLILILLFQEIFYLPKLNSIYYALLYISLFLLNLQLLKK
jgi:hypothetical protein